MILPYRFLFYENSAKGRSHICPEGFLISAFVIEEPGDIETAADGKTAMYQRIQDIVMGYFRYFRVFRFCRRLFCGGRRPVSGSGSVIYKIGTVRIGGRQGLGRDGICASAGLRQCGFVGFVETVKFFRVCLHMVDFGLFGIGVADLSPVSILR